MSKRLLSNYRGVWALQHVGRWPSFLLGLWLRKTKYKALYAICIGADNRFCFAVKQYLPKAVTLIPRQVYYKITAWFMNSFPICSTAAMWQNEIGLLPLPNCASVWINNGYIHSHESNVDLCKSVAVCCPGLQMQGAPTNKFASNHCDNSVSAPGHLN